MDSPVTKWSIKGKLHLLQQFQLGKVNAQYFEYQSLITEIKERSKTNLTVECVINLFNINDEITQ